MEERIIKVYIHYFFEKNAKCSFQSKKKSMLISKVIERLMIMEQRIIKVHSLFFQKECQVFVSK